MRPRFLCAAILVTSAAFADGPAPAPAADSAKIVEALKSTDRAARLDAAVQAKSVQDDKLLAPLVAALDDEDSAVRETAVAALGARTGSEAKKKAASALNARLVKDAKKPDATTETIAVAEALGRLAQVSSVDALAGDIAADADSDVVTARLMALANVPAPQAIEALIQFLARGGRGGAKAHQICRQALRSATGEDLGGDPDAWRAWWRDAKKTFDFDAAARRREEERAKHDKPEKKKKDEGGEKK